LGERLSDVTDAACLMREKAFISVSLIAGRALLCQVGTEVDPMR
jgi:hypothetical protein